MDIETLSEVVKECQISTKDLSEYFEGSEEDNETVLDNDYKANLANWPQLKASKIPTTFLHQPVDFEKLVQKLLSMKIKIYQPTLSNNFIKIVCVSNNDHKYLIKYLDKKQLPYHTFGNPSKRKIKVVIRGIRQDIPLDKIKAELKSNGVPVIRVHKMTTKDNNPNMLVLAVMPFDDKGIVLLGLRKLLGYNVSVEALKPKPIQCYRCQKWGHSERYCHGEFKCVKCAGNHSYKKCPRSEDTTDPPKCANCGKGHTANYKKCPKGPFTERYTLSKLQIPQQVKAASKEYKKRVIVTFDNCHSLYA